MILIQESLDFEFFSSDSMGFIPMHLSPADLAALEPYHSKPLEFSPSPWPVLLLKTHYITNVASDGHSLNLFDFANYLKNHKDCTLLVSTILFAPNTADRHRTTRPRSHRINPPYVCRVVRCPVDALVMFWALIAAQILTFQELECMASHSIWSKQRHQFPTPVGCMAVAWR